MIQYKGCSIKVVDNNDKEYPYLAIIRVGSEEIKKRGYSEEQAINLAKDTINFVLGAQKRAK